MHSLRIELAKLISVGTRITYEATGDAGLYVAEILNLSYMTNFWLFCFIGRVMPTKNRGKHENKGWNAWKKGEKHAGKTCFDKVGTKTTAAVVFRQCLLQKKLFQRAFFSGMRIRPHILHS